MSKFCPFCGEELLDDAKFCKSCGKDVASYNPNTSPDVGQTPYQPQAAEKSYTLHLVAGIILGILIPLLGIIISVYLLTRKDNPDAKTYGYVVLAVSIARMLINFFLYF